MFDWDWIATTGTAPVMVLVSGIGIYVALMIFTRISGLRSFSKMSSFDFAITVAFGSVLASTVLAKDPTLVNGVVALAVFYGIQYAISKTRRSSTSVEWLVDNRPLLLMAGPKVLSDHMDKARMTEEDLLSKLRMAGVTHPDQVLAVVFETSGDVAVMKKSGAVDPWLFKGVRGTEHLPFKTAGSG